MKSVEERPGQLGGRTGAERMGRWGAEAGRWRSGTSPAGGRRRLAWRGEGGWVGRRGEGGRGEGGRGEAGRSGEMGREAPACKGKVAASNERLLLACVRKI